ncbi:MAG: hypothetical protein U0744_19270 [Gemmataceae bacterium]
MGKFWSFLFGITMVACIGLFVVAPFAGWWMAEPNSLHASRVDNLFYVILAVTGFFFILTEGILVAFMWKYEAKPNYNPADAAKADLPGLIKPLANVFNTPHKIEVAWTLVPAAILLYVAIAQISTWADIKYLSRMEKQIKAGDTPIVCDVSARQFEWRVRYPNTARFKTIQDKKDKKDWEKFSPHYDDLHVVNEVHAVKNKPILVHLSTRDVIHSFNVPHMRVKQDALPGKMIPVWFTPINANVDKDGKETKVWEIPCAELCGWGHVRMVGRLYVHETVEDYKTWLTGVEKLQRNGVTPPQAVAAN